MTLGTEAREHVASLTDGELDAMLGRQLSARLRHAAEAERDVRGHRCGVNFYTWCDGCRTAYGDAGIDLDA